MEFTYNSENQKVSTYLFNEVPYFIATEVCRILGLSNPTETLRALDDDEKLTSEILRAGQKRKVNFINESGLYNLIFRSNKPEAKLFRKWVTNEVLPQIRATGSYGARAKEVSNYFDARDIVYDTVELNGHGVRHIIIEDADWYSVNDITAAIGADTQSTQLCKKLNAKREMARKIYIFGNTHPAWFVRSTGLNLILAGSRMLKSRGLKLILPVPVSPLFQERGRGEAKKEVSHV